MEDVMTTPRLPALVSLCLTLSITLPLGACAGAASRAAPGSPSPTAEVGATSFRFDNEGREPVRVYLIGERREWMLGRVEPGAIARFRLPDEAMASDARRVQIAVLSGSQMTLRAARENRAMLSIPQPASALTSQRWRFTQGQLSPLGLRGSLADAGR
jgi:hypothetical protein